MSSQDIISIENLSLIEDNLQIVNINSSSSAFSSFSFSDEGNTHNDKQENKLHEQNVKGPYHYTQMDYATLPKLVAGNLLLLIQEGYGEKESSEVKSSSGTKANYCPPGLDYGLTNLHQSENQGIEIIKDSSLSLEECFALEEDENPQEVFKMIDVNTSKSNFLINEEEGDADQELNEILLTLQ